MNKVNIMNNLIIKEVIGIGASSMVYKAQMADSLQQFAIKKIDFFGKNESEVIGSLQEALILHCQNYNGIIKCYDCLYNSEEESLYLILDYAEYDLLKYLQHHKQNGTQIKEAFIWKLIADIAQSLLYIHSQGIIHRDLKPSNILIKKNQLLIADFNISSIQSNMTLPKRTLLGTPNYLSPEYYKGRGDTVKSDIWAFGMLVYELCCLSNPNSSKQICQIEQTLRTCNFTFNPLPAMYSQCLKQLISNMLTFDHQKRISARQILDYCNMCGMNVQYYQAEQPNYIAQFIHFYSLQSLHSNQWINIFKQYDTYVAKRAKIFQCLPIKLSSVQTTAIKKQNTAPNKIRKLKKSITYQDKKDRMMISVE